MRNMRHLREPKPDDEGASARPRAEDRHSADGTRLREVALLFLRLGTTAFGGPAAHIATMEDEIVRRRGWITREHFLDLFGATNLVGTALAVSCAQHSWPTRVYVDRVSVL